jgi:hypothetical protein
MNQLFNPVNYFEFQAFEVFRRRSIPPSYFFLLTFRIVPGNKKAAEAFLRAAAFG